MGRMKGLVWKEWMQYKGMMILGIITSVIGTIASPFLLKRMVEMEEHISEVHLITSSMWMYAYIIFFLAIFFTSLEKEMKRPDIWFHNQSSAFTLVGAKLLTTSLFSLAGLLINAFVTIVEYYLIVEENNLGFMSLLQLELLLIITTYLVALGATIGLLTMWILWRLLKPLNTSFAYIAAITVYFYFHRTYLRITESEAYQNFASHWKIHLEPIELLEIKGAYFAVFMDYTNIYLFDLFIRATFLVILFLLSVLVIQKRVRGYQHD